MSIKLQEKFNHLLAVISSERFLKMQGLGNEIPFYICPFNQNEFSGMGLLQKQLLNSLQSTGIAVLEVNLYDLSIEILKEREILNQIFEVEETISKDQLKELLQGVLDSETNLIPAIAKKIQNVEYQVLFLTGVGEVFPYIRSHNVLNNLQSTAKEKPTVMFFPGNYTHSVESGASLDLFGKLHDDKYYRAFNIFHCEI
ncbi:DUF1788 domain-containing protein [Leptospira ognonensis]|uniref:DUF1788 domain-containing protein n=1 Tax=Leptospira ognonensis TaxID=2484945 RepID=A0A4R9K2W6_9LEPT|nr:DUF1788 domain-containing protein [Leptospira ognonensis]TGL58648.1 DUF1788 domain-containing protein [Leptospira ognonensis]